MNLTPEQLAARLTMPRNKDGHVCSLFTTPPKEVPTYEAEWRAWIKANPSRLWPAWVKAWIEKRKREKL